MLAAMRKKHLGQIEKNVRDPAKDKGGASKPGSDHSFPYYTALFVEPDKIGILPIACFHKEVEDAT